MTGQNNGAGHIGRVRETLSVSMRYGLWMMVVGGIILYPMAEPMMKAFTQDPLVVSHGVNYLRIAAITLCSYVILFQTVNLLQGLKRPMFALVIGLYRQIVAPLLVFYLLAFQLDMKENGVWWGVFLVTWSAAILTHFYGRHVLKGLKEEDGKAEATA